jgi:hypothetical protein
MAWDSIEGMALTAGWMVRGMNPWHNRLFSLPKKFQTGSGADPLFYKMDTEFLPGV